MRKFMACMLSLLFLFCSCSDRSIHHNEVDVSMDGTWKTDDGVYEMQVDGPHLCLYANGIKVLETDIYTYLYEMNDGKSLVYFSLNDNELRDQPSNEVYSVIDEMYIPSFEYVKGEIEEPLSPRLICMDIESFPYDTFHEQIILYKE